VGRLAGDRGGARGELTPERNEVRLEPLYTVTFTTPEAWSVEVATDAGIEGRGFLLAEGRSTGRLSARYRAANFPWKRADGALVPEFRGVLDHDDGAAILFEWQGLAVLADPGMRRLLGDLVHTTDDPSYRWRNDRVCAVEGEVRTRTDGSGFAVVIEVSEMVWGGTGMSEERFPRLPAYLSEPTTC
jgi:hypothetical protein